MLNELEISEVDDELAMGMMDICRAVLRMSKTPEVLDWMTIHHPELLDEIQKAGKRAVKALGRQANNTWH